MRSFRDERRDSRKVSLTWEGCGDRPRVQTPVKEDTRSEEERVRDLLMMLSPSFLFSSKIQIYSQSSI